MFRLFLSHVENAMEEAIPCILNKMYRNSRCFSWSLQRHIHIKLRSNAGRMVQKKGPECLEHLDKEKNN